MGFVDSKKIISSDLNIKINITTTVQFCTHSLTVKIIVISLLTDPGLYCKAAVIIPFSQWSRSRFVYHFSTVLVPTVAVGLPGLPVPDVQDGDNFLLFHMLSDAAEIFELNVQCANYHWRPSSFSSNALFHEGWKLNLTVWNSFNKIHNLNHHRSCEILRGA